MKVRLHRSVIFVALFFGLLIAVALCTAATLADREQGSGSESGAAVRARAFSAEEREAQSDITVDEAHFPDPVFRQWLLSSGNIGGAGSDGVLTAEELSSVTSIYIPTNGGLLTSLAGVEYFTSLEEVIVPNHTIIALDLTSNKELTYINCSYNRLTDLKVSGLTKVTTLFCEFNYLEELDLTGLTELTTIYCRHNVLTSLNFSTNTKLIFIETFDNRLTDIDVSTLGELQFLHIDHNKLTSLDMSHNLKLQGGGFVVRNNDARIIKLPTIPGFTVYYDDFAEQNPIDGYERLEWYADSGYTVPVEGDVEAQGQTLYGKRIPNEYVINFSGNGGSGLPSSVKTEYDAQTPLPEQIPVRKGYTFVGWSKDAYNAKVVYAAGESVLNLAGKRRNGEKVTLYAQWQAISYTVRFDGNATDVSGVMDDLALKYGTSVSLTDNAFTRVGYDFIGWAETPTDGVKYVDGQSVLNLTSTDGGVVTLYAVWELTAEEISKPYVERINRLYSDISAREYYAEDLNALQVLHANAVADIKNADKNESLMQSITEKFGQSANAVPTTADRINEIYNSWTAPYLYALDDVFNPPVTFGNAERLLTKAREALENAEPQRLAEYSSMTDFDSRAQAANEAGKLLAAYIAKLQDFSAAGEWLVRAENACGVSPSSVQPEDAELYDALITEYEAHSDSYGKYASEEVKTLLVQMLTLSEVKGYSVSMLERYFARFNKDDYSTDGWTAMQSALQSAITAVRGSASEDEVRQAVYNGRESMDGVPTKADESETPDPEQPNPDDPEKPDPETPDPDEPSPDPATLVTVIVLAVIAAALAVTFVVIVIRRRKGR